MTDASNPSHEHPHLGARAHGSDVPITGEHADSELKRHLLSGRRILPKPISGSETAAELIGETFLAYNAARLREACRLLAEKMLAGETTVGMSLAGALTPAGLGVAAIVPMINAGFVDWIVSTGANLYHDLHFALNLPLFAGSPSVDDRLLRRTGVIRIYDILFDADTLYRTDAAVREMLAEPAFQHEMGSAELHHLLGERAARLEDENDMHGVSVLAAAWRAGVPIHCSSPGDSTLGMQLAALELAGGAPRVNPSIDVNETAAYVYEAKRSGGRSGVLLVGGGSPKNFILQTEPQIQEILGLDESGHDYFLQMTDARPDTGGLSGATPHEAVSWGKVDPDRLPDAVVAYVDSTVALPLLVHYALANREPRQGRRLYDRRDELVARLRDDYLAGGK